MANFLQAFEITMINEGSWCRTPRDSGGETYRGISRNNWPIWPGWAIVDAKKTRKIPHPLWMDDQKLQDLVRDFYKREFWDHFQGDKIKYQELANEIFDTAANMGEKTEILFLQQCLNLLDVDGNAQIVEDGSAGAKTVAAINALTPNDAVRLFKMIDSLQGAKYINIARANPSQKKFLRGWFSHRIR